MKTYRSHKKQVNKIVTRVAGTLCFFGALGCILMVAIGGAFPSSEHGTQIVVPRTGDVWEVGELHTVQWTMTGLPTTNKTGQPLMAMFILSYAGGSPDSHVLLGHLTDWFPVSDRLANIMVPSVPTREDYSLHMFCHDDPEVSSWSSAITIFNPENVQGTKQPPHSLDVTTAPPVSVTMSLTSTYSDRELPTVHSGSTTTSGSASRSSTSGFGLASIAGLLSGSPTATSPVTASATTTGPTSTAGPTTGATPTTIVATSAPTTTETEPAAESTATPASHPSRMKRSHPRNMH